MAIAGDVIHHHGDRYCDPILTTRCISWFYEASVALLAAAGAVGVVLRQPDTSRQNVAFKEELDLIEDCQCCQHSSESW